MLVRLGLLELHTSDTLRVVLASNLDSGVPVTLVLVHVNGFLRLIGLDEFFLGFLESVIIFKVEGKLKMHIWELVAGVVLSKLEGVIEFLLVCLKVNSSLDETVLDQELGTTISAHALCNLDSNFTELFLGAVSLGNTKGFIVHVMGSVHVNTIGPRARFDVVMLSLLEVTVHLERLSEVEVSVFKQIGSEFHDKSDHLVKHLSRLVHVDGKIRLSS